MIHSYRERGRSNQSTFSRPRRLVPTPRSEPSGFSHLSIAGKLKPRYPDWSHKEIIEHQNEELHDVLTSPSPTPLIPESTPTTTLPRPLFGKRKALHLAEKMLREVEDNGESWGVDRIADSFVGDITDSRGRIRLGLMRKYFKWRGLEKEKGREVIKECYEEWVTCSEYLHFEVINRITGEKEREVYRKCAKRGNDVYRWRLKKRLEWIDELDEEEFFSCKDRDVRGETTKILFANLTYDTKLCSRREAWEQVGEEWNRWITAVRRKYGRVKHYRCFEAHENGYPHVHAVLIFRDKEFEVSYRDKNNRFRILRKEKDWFAGKWHSFVDIQACYSTGAFGYVKKYMLKVHGKRNDDVKGVTRESAQLTLSLLWLFRKQSFSVSGGMRELINDLIVQMRNSNVFSFQVTLERIPVFEYRLVDVVTLAELGLEDRPPPYGSKLWSFELPLTRHNERKLSRDQKKLSYYIPR